MLLLNIQQHVYTDWIQSPHTLWRRLNIVYGLSLAEERLFTIKTMINLQPQNNPIAMMRQWEALTTWVKEKAYSATDIEVGEVLNARSVLARRYGRQEKGRKKTLFRTS